jgi:hypothetical protein
MTLEQLQRLTSVDPALVKRVLGGVGSGVKGHTTTHGQAQKAHEAAAAVHQAAADLGHKPGIAFDSHADMLAVKASRASKAADAMTSALSGINSPEGKANAKAQQASQTAANMSKQVMLLHQNAEKLGGQRGVAINARAQSISEQSVGFHEQAAAAHRDAANWHNESRAEVMSS